MNKVVLGTISLGYQNYLMCENNLLDFFPREIFYLGGKL
jgi:hypothetical protein